MEFFIMGELGVHPRPAAGLGGPKQRAVLALLTLEAGIIVSFDRLIDAVWGERPPERAIVSVRSYVANLRRALPEARIVTHSSGYQLVLGADDSVDLSRFEEAVLAAQQYLRAHDPEAAVAAVRTATSLASRGVPVPELGDWPGANAARARAASLSQALQETSFEAQLASGLSTELIPQLEAAVAASPTQERLWQQLMLALYRAGRRADAVNAYARVREILLDELGVTPSRQTRGLFERMCANAVDDLLTPRAAAARPHPGTHAHTRSGLGATGTRLFGRTVEERRIAEVVRQAGAGYGQLVVLSGESGIGKTALARLAWQTARENAMVTATATHPDGAHVPMAWAWVQVLRTLGDELGARGRAAMCAAAPQIAALVPEWQEWSDLRNAAPDLAPGFELLHAIGDALVAAASIGPVLVVLDDLQRADTVTIDALAQLTWRIDQHPIAVVAAVQAPAAASEDVPELIGELMSRPATVVMALRGIDPAGIDALSAYLAAEHATAPPAGPRDAGYGARMHALTGGNPFYVRELILAGERLPESVVAVLARRLRVLGQDTVLSLACGALLGGAFSLGEVAHARGAAVQLVEKHLAACQRVQVLACGPGQPNVYAFVHGLARDAVVAMVAPENLRELHAGIAWLLAAQLADEPYERVLAAADHAWQAGTAIEPAMALRLLEAAAAQASERGAYPDVALLAERGLELARQADSPPQRRAVFWRELAGVWGNLKGFGHPDTVRARNRALELDPDGDSNAYMHCLTIGFAGKFESSRVQVDGLLAAYEANGDFTTGIAAHYMSGLLHFMAGDLDQFALDHAEVERLARDPLAAVQAVRFEVRSASLAAMAAAARGHIDEALAIAEEGIALGRSSNDAFSTAIVRVGKVLVRPIAGQAEGTAGMADALVAEFRSVGLEPPAWWPRIAGAWAHALDAGTCEHADDAYEAYEAGTADGMMFLAPLMLTLLADIEMVRGERSAALVLLARAERIACATGERMWDTRIADRRQLLTTASCTPAK